jgi:hypothetical protein
VLRFPCDSSSALCCWRDVLFGARRLKPRADVDWSANFDRRTTSTPPSSCSGCTTAAPARSRARKCRCVCLCRCRCVCMRACACVRACVRECLRVRGAWVCECVCVCVFSAGTPRVLEAAVSCRIPCCAPLKRKHFSAREQVDETYKDGSAYYAQNYVRGTKCDVTGEPRQVRPPPTHPTHPRPRDCLRRNECTEC